ncbi:MAG: ATP-binding cassette domain-containing protein, partial [Thermodesulfobacteriota bacterium]|nr:ATP-binding cassette domain-containing protein [Thermodesulfobacteriota bacterium]
MDKKNTTQQPLLDVQSISLVFGNTVALNNVSFNLFENEFLSIIGPNGAGKTCILNCIC